MAVAGLCGVGQPGVRCEAAVLGEGVQSRVPGRLDAGRFQIVAEAVPAVTVGQQDREGEVRGALDGQLIEAELDAGDISQALAIGA
jgi:hypothetical protein